MISTTGGSLFDASAIHKYITELLPKASIITPNIPEALEILKAHDPHVSIPDHSERTLKFVAKSLKSLGPKYVLLKGGHATYDDDSALSSDLFVFDILYDGSAFTFFRSPRLHTKNTHGTGCTLASAIACFLAHDQSMVSAVRDAINYVHGSIENALNLGKGHGPVNHMYSLYRLPFNPYGLELQ